MFKRTLFSLLLALVPLMAAAPGADAQQYDLLIRNGKVLDGTGNPWYYADVAVSGDKIVAVGNLSGAEAKKVVDAAGLYVAPGFIDTHSHSSGGLSKPSLSAGHPILAQGITTVLINPDGGGPVDMVKQRERLLKDGLGPNVAQMVPHGGVRRAVLGSEDRAPSPAELDKMRDLVRKGMEAGAFGLTSGLYYAPASFAKTDELIELAKVAAAYGGAYNSHIRDESDYTIGVVAAVDEVIAVAREARLPSVVTHIKALGPRVWGYSNALVHRIERAREEGLEVYADQYPYDASSTGLSAALLPRWAQAGGRAELIKRLNDPETRAKIRVEVVENLDRRGGADRIQFSRYAKDRSIEGRTLQEVAAERKIHPVDLALELFSDGRAPGIVSFNMHADDIATFMKQPWTMTASDGGLVEMGKGVPHPRGYGTFPRKIRKYVIEEGVVDLSTAIRSMTSLPATVYRIPQRGELRPGKVADIVVFDLETIRDNGTFDNPHQLASGMVHVIVNGGFAIEGGELARDLHGKVLSRADAAPRLVP